MERAAASALPLPFVVPAADDAVQASGRNDGNVRGGGEGDTVGYRRGSREEEEGVAWLVADAPGRPFFDVAASSSSESELESLLLELLSESSSSSLSESSELELLALLDDPESLLEDDDAAAAPGAVVAFEAPATLSELDDDDEEEELELELEPAGDGDRAKTQRKKQIGTGQISLFVWPNREQPGNSFSPFFAVGCVTFPLAFAFPSSSLPLLLSSSELLKSNVVSCLLPPLRFRPPRRLRLRAGRLLPPPPPAGTAGGGGGASGMFATSFSRVMLSTRKAKEGCYQRREHLEPEFKDSNELVEQNTLLPYHLSPAIFRTFGMNC